MNTLKLPLFLFGVFFALSLSLHAQAPTAYDAEASLATAEKPVPAPLNPYRFHKKLPSLYNGYAIEVIASNYPLDRSNPVFRQFGNIFYDKLERGGYSYLILGKFSSDESALHFLQNMIIPKADEARLIHYKEGIRKVVRQG